MNSWNVRALVAAWLVACGFTAVARAEPPAPIAVQALYGNRLLFDAQGAPLVAVGLMHAASVVELHTTEHTTVLMSPGSTRVRVPAETVVRVERVSSVPARTETVWVLETLSERRHAAREAVSTRWAAHGVDVSFLPVGGVYGMKGTVVDIRALLAVSRVRPPAAVLSKTNIRPAPLVRRLSQPALHARVTVGTRTFTIRGKNASVQLVPTGNGATRVIGVEHSRGYKAHGYEDRDYRRRLVIAPGANGKMAVVNVVPESDLVAGILPSEMFASAPMAALRAQAVTARGELFAKIGRRHFADPFLLCSEQHCQVYKGVTAEHPRSNRAALDTAGELAFTDGKLVDSVYSACAGGHTEANDVVWGQNPSAALRGTLDVPGAAPEQRAPFAPGLSNAGTGDDLPAMQGLQDALALDVLPLDLRDESAVRRFLEAPRDVSFSGRSTFNRKHPHYRWTRHIPLEWVQQRVARFKIGTVKALQVRGRGAGGRLRALAIVGTAGEHVIERELPVRRFFGNLRSGLFVVDAVHDDTGSLTGFTLSGAGYGHGSGMSQQGAIGMAESGFNHEDIIQHYYGGAVVRRVF